MLPGCATLGPNVSKAVTIEYDQVMNFESFRFKDPISVQGHFQKNEWFGVGSYGDQGRWLVYVICAIRNDGPSQESFNFNISNFYVNHEDASWRYGPPPDGAFAMLNHNLYPADGLETAALWKQFRAETQNGPDKMVLPPGVTFPLWRVVIWVPHTQYANETEIFRPELPLRYEGAPVVMVSRNNRPELGGDLENPVSHSGMPTECRPPPLN